MLKANENHTNRKPDPFPFTSRWLVILPIALAIALTWSYVSTERLFMSCQYQSIVDCGSFSVLDGLTEGSVGLNSAVSADDYLRRGNGRVGVRVASWAHIFAIVFAVIAGLVIINRSLGIYGAIGSAVLSGVVAAAVASSDNLPILKPLAEATIQVSYGGMNNFVAMSKLFNTLGFYSTTMMMLTLGAILYSKAKRGESLEVLEDKRKELSFVLYMMTALLIIGMWRVNAGYDWARTFLQPAPSKMMEDFLNSVQMELGAFFTVLLAATYLPTAYILQKRAEIAAKIEHPSDEPADILTKRGFNFSMRDAFPRIIAIASPLVSGGLLDLLSRSIPK